MQALVSLKFQKFPVDYSSIKGFLNLKYGFVQWSFRSTQSYVKQYTFLGN